MTEQEKNQLRVVVIAITITAAIIATLLLPAPPAQAPSVELTPELNLVEKAQAAEIAPEPLPVPPQLPAPLKRICSCESMGVPDAEPRQFEKDGSVLRGRVNSQDVGMCQINEGVWKAKAVELGFDLHTEVGNADMARWIYSKQGTQPWSASKKCHGL